MVRSGVGDHDGLSRGIGSVLCLYGSILLAGSHERSPLLGLDWCIVDRDWGARLGYLLSPKSKSFIIARGYSAFAPGSLRMGGSAVVAMLARKEII